MQTKARFGAPSYVEVEVRQVDGDHVDVVGADGPRRFAIGHLPRRLVALLVPGSRVGVQVADAGMLTMLGPLDGEAIVDMRDPDPSVCPVALNIIRTHATDPGDTLRDFLSSSALLAGTNGSERSRVNDRLLSYSVVDRTLSIGYENEDAAFEPGALIINAELPQTVANALPGTPIDDVVDHPFLKETGAVISTMATDAGTTRIGWEAPPRRVRDLPETE